MTIKGLIISLVLLGGFIQPSVAKERADTLFINGNILTLSDPNQIVSSLAVKDGRIIAIGNDGLSRQFASANTIDLKGKTVMPGFNDTHIHINGQPNYYVDLTKTRSIAELQQQLKDKVREIGGGKWITGYGWSEDQFAEQRKPSRLDLDKIAPNNPVMFTRAGAHSAVFSSEAFKIAGITAQTPDPQGGTIERDKDGQLNGIIRERHEELVGKLIPIPPATSLRASLVEELEGLFELGITSFTQAISTIDYYPEWEAIYRQNQNQLPRATIQHYYAGTQKMAQFRARYENSDIPSTSLRIGPIKLLVDGGFTGPAAYTKRPYKGEDTYRGALNLSEAEIADTLTSAHRQGWQLGVHAIGDAAIELVVEQLADFLTRFPRTDHRHYLNHFTVMPSKQTMQTMAKHNIAITQQPNFMYTLEGRYVEYLDGKRLAHNNPMATPIKHGIHVAMSSDILPLGPWVGIYAATTRKGASGAVYAAEEKISRLDALRAYTTKGAYLTFEEHQKGTLTQGMFADLIVLDRNPLEVPDEQLLQIKTEQTYLAGKLVFDAQR